MTSNLLKKALAALFGLLVLTAGAHAANITVSGTNAGFATNIRSPTDRGRVFQISPPECAALQRD